jgi:hypothetical protein
MSNSSLIRNQPTNMSFRPVNHLELIDLRILVWNLILTGIYW